MSSEAVGYVFRHCPFTGAAFTVLLAIADSVNDQNNNEFWMKQERLAEKARVSRETVSRLLPELEESGWIELLEFKPNGGANHYRFCFPEHPVVFESRTVVTRGHNRCDLRSQPMRLEVTSHKSNPSRTQVEPKNPLTSPLPFTDTSTTSLASKTRSRQKNGKNEKNEIWETLAQTVGFDDSTSTASERKAFAKVVNELRAVNAVPNEIESRASEYHRRFPRATLTAFALAKHWSSLNAEDDEPKEMPFVWRPDAPLEDV